jgi:hypothetical protein
MPVLNSKVKITQQNILQNKMSLTHLIADQGSPCGLIKVVCCVYIPKKSMSPQS